MQIQVVLDKVVKRQGSSMYKLAKTLGVKPNALTVTKRPGYNPKLESLVLWSHALKCPITDLFEVKGKPTFPTISASKTALKTAAGKNGTAKKPAKPAKKPAKTTAKTKN